jgi:hypothetical protein
MPLTMRRRTTIHAEPTTVVRGSAAGRSRMIVTTIVALAIVAGLIAEVAPAGAAGSSGDPGFNWYPGYYALNHVDTTVRKDKLLADPLVQPFTGVQFRYHWAASELSQGDYSAGFATLDGDLARVAASGKKLLVMLQYKESDGSHAVPSYLLTSGPWCSGTSCGEFRADATHAVAMLWNAAVQARLNAWVSAMAQHLAASPYRDIVAGIVFNETSLGTKDPTKLSTVGYDPNRYMQALQANMVTATTQAPRLIAILYYEGGFIDMPGSSIDAGTTFGNFLMQTPRTAVGMADLKPKDPKGTSHPCANATYQPFTVCAPAVQAGDYSTSVTDSFEQSFRYATDLAPTGLDSSFLTFSYAVSSGTNAFTFADVSNAIASHPIPNTTPPWGSSTTSPTPTTSATPPPTVSPTPTLSPSPTTTITPAPSTTPSPSPTTTSPPPSGAIFSDGFESGDTSAWTTTVSDGGDLAVSAQAALVGSLGLRAVVDDDVSIYVETDSPTAEPRLASTFSFDPNSIQMVDGDQHYLFFGFSGSSSGVFRVQFRYRHGAYQLMAAARDDGSFWAQTPWLSITDAPHSVQVAWKAATAPGANDGSLELTIDGVQGTALTGLDNDTRRIDTLRLGAASGIDPGTRGTYYFDDLTVTR